MQVGSAVYLNCRISLLQDKTVSILLGSVCGSGWVGLVIMGNLSLSLSLSLSFQCEVNVKWFQNAMWCKCREAYRTLYGVCVIH